MKKALWISLGFVIFFWLLVITGFVFTICRNMVWANASGEWFVGVYNEAFDTEHTVLGFYSRLADILVIAAVFLSIVTLFIIILAVKLKNSDEEEEEEEKSVKKEKKDKPVKEKKNKKSKTEEAIDTTEKVVTKTVSTTKTVNDFLNSIRKK